MNKLKTFVKHEPVWSGVIFDFLLTFGISFAPILYRLGGFALIALIGGLVVRKKVRPVNG